MSEFVSEFANKVTAQQLYNYLRSKSKSIDNQTRSIYWHHSNLVMDFIGDMESALVDFGCKLEDFNDVIKIDNPWFNTVYNNQKAPSEQTEEALHTKQVGGFSGGLECENGQI